MVEQDGLEFLLPQHLQSPVHKHRKFISHLDEQFDQNMFVLSISTFIMTTLMSCSLNNIIDINRIKLVEKDGLEFLLPQHL
jgi:hypothetical protein